MRNLFPSRHTDSDEFQHPKDIDGKTHPEHEVVQDPASRKHFLMDTNQVPRKHFFSTKKIAAVIAALVCVGLIIFLINDMRGRNADETELPIILSNEEEVVGIVREGLVARRDQVIVTFSALGQYHDQVSILADQLFEKALEPTGDPKEGDYLKFQYAGYQVKYSNPANDAGGYDYTIRIIPNYYTNSMQEEVVDKTVQTFLADAAFTADTTDYEKIKTVHDYIAANCEYDWRNKALSYRHTKATAYGALVNGEATCQGYSVAMYRLLMESGIGCRIVTGDATSPETGDTEYHAWNLVELDGRWYNVDISWDDETESEDYFLKSDASFSDHVREEEYKTDEFRAAYPVSEEDYD